MDYYDLDAGKAFMVTQKALIVDGNKVLVLKNTFEPPLWELPGGLLEMGEDRDVGLKREVKEETGLVVSIGDIIAVWDFWQEGFVVRDGRALDVRVIGIAYRCTRTGGTIRLSAEHSAYQWTTVDELRQLEFAANSRTAIDVYLAVMYSERSRP